MSRCKVSVTSESVIDAKMRYKEGWEQWFLVSSDRHWDNPHSDLKMQKRHLDEAVEKNAKIIDLGDFFCAMQGKYDPRANKDSIRPEHNVNNYLDAIVSDAANFFAPYAKNMLMIGQGNHETSILKRHETDLTARLVELLNKNSGAKVIKGDYAGWIRFMFCRDNSSDSDKHCYKMKYHHGFGAGNAQVTKGVISAQRMSVYLPDADIVITGHVHEEWEETFVKERLSQSGRVYLQDQVHICVPGYKEEYGTGSRGWHVQLGRPPKPNGARWLRFYYKRGAIHYDSIKAK